MPTQVDIRVADEAWIALAQLIRASTPESSYGAGAILDQVRRNGLYPEHRPGVSVHISHHNVANVRPSSVRNRMFYRLPDGSYRLYRPGDPAHPDRTGKTHPHREEIPVEHHSLIDWYESEYCGAEHPSPAATKRHPILKLFGLGKELWKGVNVDEYVRSLREESPSTPPAETADDANTADRPWLELLRHEGQEFKTATNLPFTYQIEGDTAFWVYRDGRRIEQRIPRSEFEKALRLCPLHAPGDLSKLRAPSYLFGLLTDRRIIGRG